MPEAEPTTYPNGQIRDRLANERTLLAWIRTAIALMGFGLVVAKFSLFLEMFGGVKTAATTSSAVAHLTGIILIVVGVLVALAGAQRTLAYSRLIDPAGSPPGNAVLVSAAMMVIALGVGLAIYLAVS